jgi:hypothetical protein
MREEVKGAFDALGLLLVFVTVFFGLAYPAISSALGEPTPAPEKPTERKHLRHRIRRVFFSWCFPVLVIDALSLTILFPVLRDAVRSHALGYSGSNVGVNTFVMIFALLAGLFLWSVVLTVRLAAHWRKAR